MPALQCANAQKDSNPADSAALRDFFAGLNAAWPIPQDIPLIRLEVGHPLLAPPEHGHARASCRVCGHTFRPSDRVVICPCSPDQPKCWDEWVRARKEETCLGMS
jgi:hypothetical protein